MRVKRPAFEINEANPFRYDKLMYGVRVKTHDDL